MNFDEAAKIAMRDTVERVIKSKVYLAVDWAGFSTTYLTSLGASFGATSPAMYWASFGAMSFATSWAMLGTIRRTTYEALKQAQNEL